MNSLLKQFERKWTDGHTGFIKPFCHFLDIKELTEKTKKETIKKTEKYLIDYLKKLCWKDREIEMLLNRLPI